MTNIISMWSGPRNLSTALMRSFSARADCTVWDEPFFAPFLHVTNKAHPGRAETLAAHETNARNVSERIKAPVSTAYLFLKNMSHHMLDGFSRDWMVKARHFFLLRDPKQVIVSYAKGRADFDLEDLGFASQRQLFDELTDMIGAPPPVIHSLDILRKPEAALRALCQALDMPFDLNMLSWEAGSRPEDGAWAPYWYGSVESSTGFRAPSDHDMIIPVAYQALLAQCQDDFDVLERERLVI